MSNHETPMIRWYWEQVGGTLVEEFPAVARAAGCGNRLIDAIILPDGPDEIASRHDVNLEGQEIIVVQAKRGRLGMNLMGQALFSAVLMKAFQPRYIHSVALCEADDSVLGPILKAYGDMDENMDMKVVVAPGDVMATAEGQRTTGRRRP